MHIIYNLLFFLAAWRWGDWKNWTNYYPTILFFILLDLLYNFLTYNRPLWMFHERLLPTLLPNHTLISLLIMFVSYPATIMIYLKNFYKTEKWVTRFFHYIFWVVLYLSVEFINIPLGLISYHNGWGMWDSVAFVMAMFIILPIHYKKPLWAWAFTLAVLLILWNQYDFPQYLK